MSHRLPIALEAQKQGYQVHIATAITDKLNVLQKHGLIVHPLVMDRSKSGLGTTLRTMIELWQVFMAIRPDVVHLVTIKPVLLGGLMARLAKVPAIVVAVSGLGYVFIARGIKAGLRRWIVSLLYRLVLDHPNIKVIFQNADDRDSLLELTRLSPANVQLIRGSGVNLSEYCFSPLPTGVPVVLLAARLLKDKGVCEFVLAAQLLKQQGVSARFCLVGSVDPANPASLTETELVEWEEQGVVELWGHRSDMPETLSRAYIVVLPSYREGLPKVLLEAAACGRAVVTTDVPGCRDAIEPDISGVLVPVRDPSTLAIALKNLIGDPVRCLSMGKAGRKLAEQNFDVKQVIAIHLQIYQELLNSAQHIQKNLNWFSLICEESFFEWRGKMTKIG